MVIPLSAKNIRRGPFPVEAGSAHPLGATPSPSGVNFSLASSNATGVELLLFSAHDALEPFQTIRFDRRRHVWCLRCDEAAKSGTLTWRHILLEEVFEALAESDPAKLRTESIQSAAVIAAWVEDIDSRG